MLTDGQTDQQTGTLLYTHIAFVLHVNRLKFINRGIKQYMSVLITTAGMCQYLAQQPNAGQGRLMVEVFRSRTITHHSRQDYPGRGIGPSQRPLPDSTQHSQDRHPCPRRNSNPQSQQASGRRSSPQTARPLRWAFQNTRILNPDIPYGPTRFAFIRKDRCFC